MIAGPEFGRDAGDSFDHLCSLQCPFRPCFPYGINLQQLGLMVSKQFDAILSSIMLYPQFQFSNCFLARKVRKTGQPKMVTSEFLQGGPLVVINEGITPIDGLKNG